MRRTGQQQVKEPTEPGGTKLELLRQPGFGVSCKDAGQDAMLAFLDAEEVRGSNPLAPTSKDPGQAEDRVSASRARFRTTALMVNVASAFGRGSVVSVAPVMPSQVPSEFLRQLAVRPSRPPRKRSNTSPRT